MKTPRDHVELWVHRCVLHLVLGEGHEKGRTTADGDAVTDEHFLAEEADVPFGADVGGAHEKRGKLAAARFEDLVREEAADVDFPLFLVGLKEAVAADRREFTEEIGDGPRFEVLAAGKCARDRAVRARVDDELLPSAVFAALEAKGAEDGHVVVHGDAGFGLSGSKSSCRVGGDAFGSPSVRQSPAAGAAFARSGSAIRASEAGMRLTLCCGLLLTLLAACATTAPTTTAAEDDLRGDGGSETGPVEDSGTAETSVDTGAPTALPDCLGAARPLQFSAPPIAPGLRTALPYVDVTVDGYRAAFLVDFATTATTIDLGAFPIPGPMATSCTSPNLGATCTFSSFDFFGEWGSVALRTDDHRGFGGAVRQAGILGTDFLAVHAFTLDYAGQTLRRAEQGAFCSDATLKAAGFSPLNTAGYYSHTPGSVSGPNVPTVPLVVAGARAVAQLDTGFDDGFVPHAINVNEAFFRAIQATSPGALLRAPTLDAALTTCVAGLQETVEAYRLAPGTTSAFLDRNGVPVRPRGDTVLFVKRTPQAAYRCGGIGTWSEPAAQVASSFFHDAGALVFDPFQSVVWMR